MRTRSKLSIPRRKDIPRKIWGMAIIDLDSSEGRCAEKSLRDILIYMEERHEGNVRGWIRKNRGNMESQLETITSTLRYLLFENKNNLSDNETLSLLRASGSIPNYIGTVLLEKEYD